MDSNWEEVERMALTAVVENARKAHEYPEHETIERWKNIFGYTTIQAVRFIQKHRLDFTRERITYEHWDLMREDAESRGYDREAYEHNIFRDRLAAKTYTLLSHTILVGPDGFPMWLVRLKEYLNTPAKVREAGQLESEPEIVVQKGEGNRPVAHCLVD